MTAKEDGEQEHPLHVNAILVASHRALGNALDELGFPEDDDRLVELEGKLGFLTCSHDQDCDDLFALIAELAARGETWELRFRVDTAEGKAIFQTMARNRPVSAAEVEVPPESDTAPQDVPLNDLGGEEGRAALRRVLKRTRSDQVFVAVQAQRSGRATASIIERGSRRVLAAASAESEPGLRSAIREILPNVMFSVANPLGG